MVSVDTPMVVLRMRMRCYFAHPFKLKDTPEKMEILKELLSRQLIVIDPFRDEQEILDDFGVDTYWGNENWELARRIWTKDLGQISSCRIFVAWIPSYNVIGTAMEVAYAYEHNKFIQIISPLRHPSFAVYADQFFESIPEFIRRNEYRWKRFKK